MSTGETAAVLALIDPEQIAALALALGDIDSPSGHEGPVAGFVVDWLRGAGFDPQTVALDPARPNVVARLPGSGGGYSLLFNAHMDTSIGHDDTWIYRDPGRAEDHRAWREGGRLIGNGVVNDKGPLACFLLAARAIREAGVVLRGDLLLTAVSGEIEREPMEEFGAPDYLGHEVGTRFMVTHGAVADFALVAENTRFGFGPLEAGRAVFRILLDGGNALYAPYLQRPYPVHENPNAIVQMAHLVTRLEAWALEYEQRHTWRGECGTLVPKVNLGAIRGGAPYFTCVAPEVCALHVDCRTAPGQDVLAIRDALEALLTTLQLRGRVELCLYRPGYAARGIEPLADAVGQAHRQVLGTPLEVVSGPQASMWRDTNVFNELGIPAANYGPGAGRGGGNVGVELDELYRAAQVYALTALDLCNRHKPPH